MGFWDNSHHCNTWFDMGMEGVEFVVAEAKEARETLKRTRPSREFI